MTILFYYIALLKFYDMELHTDNKRTHGILMNICAININKAVKSIPEIFVSNKSDQHYSFSLIIYYCLVEHT